MNELLVSKYKNNVLAKRSKVFLSSLLDYFLIVIVSFMLFIIVTNPVISVLPSFKENINNLNDTTLKLYQIVSETRLQTFDEEHNSFISIDTDARKYVTTLLKTSLYVRGMDLPSINQEEEQIDIKDTFLNTDNNNYPNDNLSYYFYTFKSNNESLNNYVYSDIDYSNNKEDYLYLEALDFDNELFNDYFISIEEFNNINIDNDFKSSLTRFNILSEDYQSYLISYLIYNEDNESLVSIYNNLATSYKNAIQIFINEVETNFTPYLETNDSFNYYYNYYVLTYIIALLITYLITFIVFIIIIPLGIKDNRTIGLKVLKLGICRSDELEPSLFNIVIKDILLFILYFNSILFTLFFVNLLPISVFPLFNSHFSLIQVVIFSLLSLILSYIYLIFSKNHQVLSLFSSNLVIKNSEEFENIKESSDGRD
ncbi:MAG: hypothetical protein IAC58_05805 [Firmicutes bacterium]|uniref:RDD domain-containing protein n=1 Tax=Candidatus Onthovivens merdipullorum TaxID=2840889 RepID=A0A9D9DIT5_9BACL|nr:hypothetical protein [Candidatus Onthovivens merdipullorum]